MNYSCQQYLADVFLQITDLNICLGLLELTEISVT